MESLTVSLRNLFLQNLKWTYKTNRNSNRLELHATDLIGICPRYVVLCYYLGLPIAERKDDFSVKTYLTFRIGNKIEELVMEVIDGKKPPPMALRIHDLYIIGSPDILWKDKFLIECKSIKADLFDKLKKPYPRHEVQLAFYLWLAEKHNLGYSKVGAIVYIPKEEASDVIKVFPVMLTPLYRARFENLVNQIKQGIKERVLPERICADINSVYASKCKVVEACFKWR